MGGKEKLPLIIRVETAKSGATPDDTFRIPANAPGEIYRYKVDWGDGVVTSGHTGIAEHTYLTRGIFDIKIYGRFPRFYFNETGDRLKLLEVLDWGEIKYSTNQTSAFNGCNNLTSIAEDVKGWYNGITEGASMFRTVPLLAIPDNMLLTALVSGQFMFATNVHQGLQSLPNGMTLSNLTNGNAMFYVASGVGNLSSLPSSMTLSNMTNGNAMFQSNPITSAIGLNLHKINTGTLFMNAANLPVSQYSNILVDIEANNPNNGVTIVFGSSKYNATGQVARNILTSAPRSWAIGDGGLE